jgi:hypothetical protein
MTEVINVHKILDEKYEGNRTIGRPRRKGRVIIIKTEFKETVFESVDWINLAKDRDK